MRTLSESVAEKSVAETWVAETWVAETWVAETWHSEAIRFTRGNSAARVRISGVRARAHRACPRAWRKAGISLHHLVRLVPPGLVAEFSAARRAARHGQSALCHDRSRQTRVPSRRRYGRLSRPAGSAVRRLCLGLCRPLAAARRSAHLRIHHPGAGAGRHRARHDDRAAEISGVSVIFLPRGNGGGGPCEAW